VGETLKIPKKGETIMVRCFNCKPGIWRKTTIEMLTPHIVLKTPEAWFDKRKQELRIFPFWVKCKSCGCVRTVGVDGYGEYWY